jgi:hypothetical protein
MILFLNKRDLFAEKLAHVPLGEYFPEYKGGADVQEAQMFMQHLFITKNRTPTKAVYTHVTCATDTNQVSVVFGDVKDIIIRKSISEAGLLE